MRITFALPQWWLRPIGGYAVVFGHADGLVGQGHDVTVLLGRPPAGPLLEELRRREGSGESLVSWRQIDPRVRMSAIDAIADAYVPEADAIVATASNTVTDVLALDGSKGRKLQLIQGYETWMTDPDALSASWRAPIPKMVVSEWLLDIGGRIGAPPFFLTPSAIDHDRFQRRTPLEARSPSVLSLYHHAPVKGWAHTLPVLLRFHDLRPDVPVAVFGTPPRPSDLPDWASYTRDPADVAALYDAATVYLAGSLSEGFGLSGAEALACGTALVTTASGGVQEYAVHEETALLSPPGDEPALLVNLMRMVDDQDLAARTSAAGRQLVARYTWARATDALEAVIQDTVSRPVGAQTLGLAS